MDRRTALKSLTAILGASLLTSCSENINLNEEFFDRENVIATSGKYYYFRQTLDNKPIAVRVDSTKIKEYKSGRYILEWYNQDCDDDGKKLQVYTLEKLD